VQIGTRTDSPDGDWARRLGNYGALTPASPGSGGHDDGSGERHRGRRLGKLAAVIVGIALLVGLAVLGGRFLLDRSYFVGVDDEQVVIFRGVDLTIGPLELSRVFERTDLTVDELPTYYAETLTDGVAAADLADARRIVRNAPRRDEPADTAGDEDAAAGDDAAGDDAADEDAAP
jgi:PPM family protein phosphatase